MDLEECSALRKKNSTKKNVGPDSFPSKPSKSSNSERRKGGRGRKRECGQREGRGRKKE